MRVEVPTPGTGRRTPTQPGKESKPSSSRKQFWILLLFVLFCASSYLLISRFVITAVVVQGRSMAPTLQDGDRCFLDRWTLQYRDPQRGDLVVIRDPGHKDYAVKRVVAMPGEAILLKQGDVFLNNRRLHEPYLVQGVRTVGPDSRDQLTIVGPTHYFVLGDNRDYSEDSRYYGPLHRRHIIGLIAKR